MQSIYFLVYVAALAVAEPSSHNYLPPSPTNRNNGYTQGALGAPAFKGPQIIAARTLEQGSANSFSRSSQNQYHSVARVLSQGYDNSAAAFARNSIEANSTINYEADERGFKPQISYGDSEELARYSGYDSNIKTRNHGNYKNGGQVARGY